MPGFLFRLERADGEPAEPSQLCAVPNWSPGHTIHFGHKTALLAREPTTPISRPCWSSRTWSQSY
jgi:hypothetical protein